MKICVGDKFFHSCKPIDLEVLKIHSKIVDGKVNTFINYRWDDTMSYTGGYNELNIEDFIKIIDLGGKDEIY